jgi:hypothetical protein
MEDESPALSSGSKPTASYGSRLTKQVLRECKAWSVDQIMPLMIAFIGAMLTVYFHLVSLPESHSLYKATFLAFIVAFPIYLAWQVLWAPYVLDREAQAALQKVLSDNKRFDLEERRLELEERQIAAQEAHTRELSTQNSQTRREQMLSWMNPQGPMATVKGSVGDTRKVSILVTNKGQAADFYAVFSISGQIAPEQELFALWEHTDSIKTTIAKGQTRRIILANMMHRNQLQTWQICATSETGHRFVQAPQHSCAVSTPIARAADIIITGQVVAEPDLVNGIQPFKVVLHAFEAEYV